MDNFFLTRRALINGKKIEYDTCLFLPTDDKTLKEYAQNFTFIGTGDIYDIEGIRQRGEKAKINFYNYKGADHV